MTRQGVQFIKWFLSSFPHNVLGPTLAEFGLGHAVVGGSLPLRQKMCVSCLQRLDRVFVVGGSWDAIKEEFARTQVGVVVEKKICSTELLAVTYYSLHS